MEHVDKREHYKGLPRFQLIHLPPGAICDQTDFQSMFNFSAFVKPTQCLFIDMHYKYKIKDC